nr:putative sulfate exporter family transporter [Pleionea sp. CnH1-48]
MIGLAVLISIAIFVGLLSAGVALLAGLVLALTLGNPFVSHCRTYSGHALKVAIIGLGFGLSIQSVVLTAKETFWLTLATIVIAMVSGFLLTRWLKLDKNTGLLISSGTAICGGSAIAAVSQAISSRGEQTIIAVTVVFLLNLVALFVFPPLGHWLELTQQEFGTWAALAIHDTSSVVGAAADYGKQALETATTAKLARALWIIPLTLVITLLSNQQGGRINIPVFIILFVLASVIASLLPQFSFIFESVAWLAKQLLVFALFLLGLSFDKAVLKQLNSRPLILGVALWVILASSSLAMILWI